jgi:hypothetical protein
VALLRGAGIPARKHFVSIKGTILAGLIDVPPYVDHSFAEVYIDDKGVWRGSPMASCYGKQGLGGTGTKPEELGYLPIKRRLKDGEAVEVDTFRERLVCCRAVTLSSGGLESVQGSM